MDYIFGVFKQNKLLYDDFVKRLKSAKRWYDLYFKNKNNELILSNGDTLFLRYGDSQLPHMLGFNSSYLIEQIPDLEGLSSYQAFEYFLNNSDFVYEKIKSSLIKPDSLFSKFSYQKINSMLNMYSIELGNILFVLKYRKDLASLTGIKPIDADYLIALRNKKNEYSIIGFRKDAGSYVAVTNIGINNDVNEEFNMELFKIIGYQTLCYPARLVTFSDGSAPNIKVAQSDSKIKSIERLRSYGNKYFTNVDTTGDTIYQFSLLKKKSKILYCLKDALEKRETISLKGEEDKSLLTIVDLYNLLINYVRAKEQREEEVTSASKRILERFMEKNKLCDAQVKMINELEQELALSKKKIQALSSKQKTRKKKH